MHLADLQWSQYDIPLRDPFITAHGTLRHRSGIILSLRLESDLTGYGECAPLPEFSGAHLNEVLKLMPRLAQELSGRTLEKLLSDIENWGQRGQFPAPLLYGLETALLDALGQEQGRSMATLLAQNHAPRSSITVNAVIGGTSIEVAAEKAYAAYKAGFHTLKIKVPPPQSSGAARAIETRRYVQDIVTRIATIRAILGPEPRLRLDANESWNFEQALAVLTKCADYDIQYVEQPLPASDLTGMARLRRVTPIPLAADEALGDRASVEQIIERGAADVLILKPQLLGGLRACKEIIQEAHRHGIESVITSTIEAGIGVTAALHLAAASPEITLACGLATLDLLTNDLLLTRPLLQGDQLLLPAGPGLGVHLNKVALTNNIDTTGAHLSNSLEG